MTTPPRDGRSSRDAEKRVVCVDVAYGEQYWYPDDGGIVWLAGYQPVEIPSGRYLSRDAPQLIDRGLRVASVAGAQHHLAGLTSDEAAPGSTLVLRRDADNPHDPNAIAVDGKSGEQIGWVARDLAVDFAAGLDHGAPWSAIALRERRDSPRDPRSGLTMLLAAGAAIELRLYP